MKELYYRILLFIFHRLPIKRKKIFFLSYYGSQYGCSPKYLSEYITAHHKDWEVIWGFTEPSRYHIEGARKVRYLSWRYFCELCTCQVFVTNYRMPEHFRKRKGQLYLQTWHSSLRLKMSEADAIDSLPSSYIKMAKKDSLQTDILLSGCAANTKVFEKSYWYNGKILCVGTPREDLLFKDDNKLKGNIKRILGVKNDKVVLYAPTFRNNHTLKYYNIDMDLLCNNLRVRFGGSWSVMMRLHPHLRNKLLPHTNENVIDVTTYEDIQELLFISDVVISDYSSLIFDFLYTKRPCFLYTPDLSEYISNDRKLYFKMDELPFPKSENNEELARAILTFDEEKFDENIERFKLFIGSYEEGDACKKVVNYLVNCQNI